MEVVRESEEEVREILNDRTREETAQELEISVYDTERNEKAKKHRRELVRVIVVSPIGQSMKKSTTQWRSQNAEKATHIKGRLLEQAVILFNCIPFQKRNFS